MIICPKCKNTIQVDSNTLHCNNCNHDVENRDGIWIFHPELNNNSNDYNSEDLEILARFENKHFWFKRRRDYIKYFITKYIPKSKSFIEIGAGTSYIAKKIKEIGYDVAVGDIHINGLNMAKKSNINQLYQFDLFSTPFEDAYDSIGMFDVLEHMEDETLALSNLHKMLKTGGYLIFTVPAHNWLWGNYDVIANHKRRYSYPDLSKLLQANGFKVIVGKNFFLSLVPVLLLRKMIQKKVISSSQIIDKNLKINPLINSLFDLITLVEFQILKHLPCKIGGSIIVIAQKEENYAI